jgi:hypothetical protein
VLSRKTLLTFRYSLFNNHYKLFTLSSTFAGCKKSRL